MWDFGLRANGGQTIGVWAYLSPYQIGHRVGALGVLFGYAARYSRWRLASSNMADYHVRAGWLLGVCNSSGAAQRQRDLQLCGGSRQALSCFARLHPLHLPKQVGGDAGTRFVFGDGQASGVVYFVTWFTKSPDLRLLAVLMKTKAHVHCIHPEHAR